MDDTLNQLITLSQHLGDPANDYVILGEGNTSARADDQSFWVKASGAALRSSSRDSFVRVRFDPVLEMLNGPELSDEEIRRRLAAAKADPAEPGHPSVETAFHAACLQLPGVRFIGHTHPTAVNMLTCSNAFEAMVQGRLFPDHVVMCGPASVLVPYTDPGLPLARAICQQVQAFVDTHGEAPKTIFLQNHGLIVLGATAQQVEKITAMTVKAARILHGTFAFGGPRFMSAGAVERIHTRPDEHYRQQVIDTE